MTYRITLVLAGGYSLSCLADEAIRDGCRQELGKGRRVLG